ncbi:MAG: spermidine synthase [Burkholderiales bacterium]
MLLHACTIALSAFLLFLVQPIIARQILPWFGGSAAVWTTCLVFFQVALLAGYFYSDWVIRRLQARQQAILHTGLLVLSLAFLPIIASPAFKPDDASQPIGRILVLLTLTIGLPYLMLATTGPLVQAWFSREFSTARVYRLYALSNLASMIALIIYPPAIEPLASGRVQAIGWSVAYGAFAILAGLCAWRAVRHGLIHQAPVAAVPAAADPIEPIALEGSAGRSAEDPASIEPSAAPSLAEQGLWLLLAALGSLLLLAITTHITQNVASVPFLWVLPLAIYLVTFILCFDGEGWYRRRVYKPLAAVVSVLLALGLSYRFSEGGFERGLLEILHAVPLYAFGLFVLCMFVHGELVSRKPAPAHLTRFYLMVSLGGAVGGLLVGIGAPLVFDWYWELPIALIVIALLVGSLSDGVGRWIGTVALITCALLVGDYSKWIRGEMIEISRNFYGTLRVRAVDTVLADGTKVSRRQLVHGEILHGEQRSTDPRLPTTYYGPGSGIGRLISLRNEGGPARVGLVGLGVGTLATYGRAGDIYRMYELNPTVLQFAQQHFSYLKDSPASIENILGDARLMLEREKDQRYDILAIDAFSSDSIPVHLMTREAIAVYQRHLVNDGAIALHITNRYLDLSGVVRRLADEAQMQAVLIADAPAAGTPFYRSTWIVLTKNPQTVQRLMEQGGQAIEPPPSHRATWTDDHHNLFEVLR